LETKDQPVQSPHATATYIPLIGILPCSLCTSSLLGTRVEVRKLHAYFYSTIERGECFEFTFLPLYPQRKRLTYVFYKKLSDSENHFGKTQLVFHWLLQRSSHEMMRRIKACCAVKLPCSVSDQSNTL